MARSRRRKRKNQQLKRGGGSLTQVSVISLVLFSLVVVGASFIAQMAPLSKLQEQENAVLQGAAERATASVAHAVARYTDGLAVVAADPQIRALIEKGDMLDISRRERELAGLFPEALRVRLLKDKIYSPDKSTEPHLGFACLDLQRQAEKLLTNPPVEVHVLDTPQQHIDIVQPVLDEAGKSVIGHVQLTLDVKLLQTWLQQAAGEGYVQLVQKVTDQKTVPLAEAGNKAGIQRTDSLTLEIAGTSWQLTSQMPQVNRLSAFSVQFLIVAGIGIGLVIIAVLMLRNSMSRAISTDLENFMLLESSILRGNKRHEYFLKMKEFREMAKRIQELPRLHSMERERDDDDDVAAAEFMQGADPMFMDKDALEVEELDEYQNTAASKRAESKRPESKREVPPKKPEAVAKPAPAVSQGAAKSVPTSMPAVPPAEIFKAYDIRGIVGRTLAPQYALLIGQALGSEAVKRGLKKIAFGRDGRLSGPELGGALVRGLQAAGLQVVDVGMVPTPLVYYAASELCDGSGVMLTGSHNPPDYNGFKMVLGGETLAGEAIQALRKRIETQDFVQGKGGYETRKVLDDYIKRVVSDVKLTRPLKVVIDCGNGVAGAVAPKLFRELGAEVIDIHSEVDGKFPNHHPDPSQPENLKDVIELVAAQGADLGIAFDGDGDRIGVVSGDGKIIWPDRLMMLYAADVLSRNHGAQIIYDIKCSSNLTKVIWEKGGEPVMWKTGHSLIKAKMKQSGALLAGEMSGHIFFKERWYGFDDALYAGARLLEILAKDLRKPKVVFAGLPNAVNTPELRVDLAEGEQHRVMDELLGKADFPDANVIMIDGVRADFADGWGLVRASNTTPSLILRFEGKDKEAMQRVQDKFRQLLLSVKPDLSLPF